MANNKSKISLVYAILVIVCGGIMYHDYYVRGEWNMIFLLTLLVLTVVYLILMFKKEKKKTGYFDETEE